MTQENKQLLLKDLSARLPYGVKVCARFNTGSRYTTNVTAICADRDYIETRQNDLHSYTGSSVEDIRPYLRPMPSITAEEEVLFRCELPAIAKTDAQLVAMRMELFLKGHLDFNHLIEKGLALKAPDDMYKTE